MGIRYYANLYCDDCGCLLTDNVAGDSIDELKLDIESKGGEEQFCQSCTWLFSQ